MGENVKHRHGRTIALAILAAGAIAIATPATAGKFKKIVDTNTLIPGGGGALFAFSDDAVPAISGNQVAFASDSSGSRTIWRVLKSGANLVKVIAPGTPVPGLGTLFADSRPQIDNDTVVVFSSAGIFTVSTNGRRLRKLVSWQDTSDVFPGADKRFAFGQFFDLRVGDGVVVFSNRKHVFSVPIAGGAVTPIAGSQNVGTSPPEPYCCLFSEPSIKNGKVFMRSGSGSASNSPFAMTSLGGSPASFGFVANASIHPPRTPSGHFFTDTGFAFPVVDQTFVFAGHSQGPVLPSQVRGIYSRGDKFIRLADDQMEVPGGGGTTFNWGAGFGSGIVAENGLVVFHGRGNTGIWGLYSVSQAGGRIRKIIAEGDMLKGFSVSGLAFGRDALSANAIGGTTLVFRAWYAGGGSGMYSIDLL
jgi:hypothetical protein